LELYVESKTDRLTDLFVCAGDRTYLIGAQDGSFPDFGHHLADEMGGIWSHPIKWMDGFWLKAKRTDLAGAPEAWLNRAVEFRNYPYGNEHRYSLGELRLEAVRRQFCPDGAEGVVVAYELTNAGEEAAELELVFLGRIDLRPVWLAGEAGIFDGEDDAWFDAARSAIVGKDQGHPWHVVFGADRACLSHAIGRDLFGPERTAGRGITGELAYERLVLDPGETATIRFFIAGSCESEEAALAAWDRLRRGHSELFKAKRQRVEALLDRTVPDIPDKHLQKVFDWIKFNTDWLVREVPGIGRGLGAGIPEYPWWFGCDNSYALQGVLPLGELKLAQDTLDLLARESEKANGNGRIIHEISTCGVVANKGNTQETPHYIVCLWETFRWTGDIEWLKRHYSLVKRGIEWLLGEMDPDGDLLPTGYGIIEIEGLNLELIDTAVYTCMALEAAAEMAELFGEPDAARRYRETHRRLRDRINRTFWLEEEGLYADVVATPAEMLRRMDRFIACAREAGAAEEAVASLKRMKAEALTSDPGAERPWLLKNWVISTPMETGLAGREQAVRALDRMATDEFTGPWGVYLSGIHRNAMMTISTGVQAVAEARYDRMDEALRYMRLIASTFGLRLPGSMSEMSPDYGCFVQAWTAYGIVSPLISHMFGIRPEAHRKQLVLRPRMPGGWREAAVRRVRIGTGDSANELDFGIALGEREDVYRFSLSQPGWQVVLNIPVREGDEVRADGRRVGSIGTALCGGLCPENGPDGGEWRIAFPGASSHEVRVRHAPD
jgi:glycogen debranching enzyme